MARTRLAIAILVCCLSATAACCEAEEAVTAAPTTPLFPVCRDGKWGYISKSAEIQITPRFIRAQEFREGLAEVETEKAVEFIDADGNTAFRAPAHWSHYIHFAEGRAWIIVNDLYACIDRSGHVVIEPQFTVAKSFSEGLAAVCVGGERDEDGFLVGGLWGYVGMDGRFVLSPRYEDASSFSSSRAVVWERGNLKYIDDTGAEKVLKPVKWKKGDRTIQDRWPFSNGLAKIGLLGPEDVHCIFVDAHGDVVVPLAPQGGLYVPPPWSVARSFSDGFAAVSIAGKWGYIDVKGLIVIQPQFDDVCDFRAGAARVRQGDRYGLIDRTGSWRIGREPIDGKQVNDAVDFDNGLALVHFDGTIEEAFDPLTDWLRMMRWTGGEWWYVNQSGELVVLAWRDGERREPVGRERSEW